MNKQIKFIFALAFTIMFSGFAIALETCASENVIISTTENCIAQTYDSCYLCMNMNVDTSTKLSDYITQMSGDAWYYETSPNTVCGNGFYYVDSNTGVLKLKTPSLPFTGDYTLKFYYGIGTPNDIGTEDFTVKCNDKTYTFNDNDDVGSEVEFRFGEVQCEFNSGYNYVEFKSTDMGSVHFKKFRITGENACPEQPFCPLNTQDYDKVVIINQKLVSQTLTGDYKFTSDLIPVALLPGKYSVTLVSRDNYTERVSTSQPNEEYKLAFFKDSTQVAITPPTDDLQDNVAFAQVIDIVTTNLMLPNGADNVKAIHSKFSEIPTPTQNSHTAVCAGIKKISEPPTCGDETCNNGETCSTCSQDCGVCPPTPRCGDNVVNQANETCDDGNLFNNDGCSSICKIESCGDNICNWLETCNTCSQDCGICPPTPRCGDNICNNGETCLSCPCDCGVCPPVNPVCGNNIKEAGEECDDGNLINDDGCSSSCDKENKECNSCDNDNKPLVLEFCESVWKCSGWSECSDGIMTRDCTDENHCDIEYNKPFESTGCASLAPAKVLEEKSGTGIFWFILGIIILIILLIILLRLLM